MLLLEIFNKSIRFTQRDALGKVCGTDITCFYTKFILRGDGVKKRNPKILKIVFLFVSLSNITFAQVIIDVPSSKKWDFGVVNRFIMGDTLPNGERIHPNAIYRLERGGYYDIDSKMKIDFNITIMADSEPSYKKPPMISRGLDVQGRYISELIEITGDGNYFKTKNIIYNGMRDDNKVVSDNASLFRVSGSQHRFEIDSCIFSGWGGSILKSENTESMAYIWTNNIFRNCINSHNPWGGNVYSMPTKNTHQDTIKFINNTFFNVASFQLLSWELVDYIEYEHNTLFVSTVNSHMIPYLINAKFNNNIFFNYQTFGQTQIEIDKGYWDIDSINGNHPSSICKLNLIDSLKLTNYGITEADRKVEYKNNVYAWSQAVTDYWATAKDSSTGVEVDIIPILWINDYTKNMFDDADSYPYLVEENNLELNPDFNVKLVKDVLAKEISFIKSVRRRESPQVPIEHFYAPDGNYWDIAWPLPENLRYTNKTALTHAQGGFPVGDLNWYGKSTMKKWKEYTITGIENNKVGNIPNNYSLNQNYPNPFNPTTKISFSISEIGLTKLSVYNILGEEVSTLVNKELSAGLYHYTFDGTGLASGFYLYRLESNNFSESRKMLLIK